MKNIEFVPKAFEEYKEWILLDRKTALRIGDLIKDILRDPYNGIGKPEPLNHQFAGCWSRRLDGEHRLIYKITESSVVIFPASIITQNNLRLSTDLYLAARLYVCLLRLHIINLMRRRVSYVCEGSPIEIICMPVNLILIK